MYPSQGVRHNSDAIWPFSRSENELSLLDTIPEVEGKIIKYNRLLESLSRSDPRRPTLLLSLAGVRNQRSRFSGQKSDLDMAITHLTEVVLLSRLRLTILSLLSFFLQLSSVHASHITDNLMISNPQSNTFAFFESTSTHLKLSTSRLLSWGTCCQTYLTH